MTIRLELWIFWGGLGRWDFQALCVQAFQSLGRTNKKIITSSLCNWPNVCRNKNLLGPVSRNVDKETLNIFLIFEARVRTIFFSVTWLKKGGYWISIIWTLRGWMTITWKNSSQHSNLERYLFSILQGWFYSVFEFFQQFELLNGCTQLNFMCMSF